MSWQSFLDTESKKDYFKKILEFLNNANAVIYPKKEDMFAAFDLCPFEDMKVVIIGQDPNINENQAHGLAFSVLQGKIPPSLLNIKKELKNEFGYEINDVTNLSCWAKQGVLLLNRVLSVEAKKANSHQNIGWESFSENVIKYINQNKRNVVFILLGNHALQCQKWIDLNKHYVVSAPHPSPLSAYRGFFNSNVFLNTNQYLKKHNLKEINWEIV